MRIGFVGFALVVVAACHDHDDGHHAVCEGDPAISDFTASSTTVAAGGTVELTFSVEHFELTGHGEHGADGGHDHGDGGCISGHVHVYLDDLMTNPIAMPETAMATVEIPAEATAGAHTLIARLHDASHLILEPQVTAELDITVE